MQGASRQALDAVRVAVRERLAASSSQLGEQLLAVSALLAGESSLRNALADNGASPQRRSLLAEQVFTGKVQPDTLAVLDETVARRWSRPRDLVEGLELLGAEALFAFAESDGRIDAVEEELFRFGRVLESSAQLQSMLTDPAVAETSKVAVVNDLLAGRSSPETVTVVRHLVGHPGAASVAARLDDLVRLAAERRQQLLADVRVPVPLSDDQSARLAAALTRLYGQPVSLAVSVDPDLLGGAVVRVSDEIIDGSVKTRLTDARRTLTQ